MTRSASSSSSSSSSFFASEKWGVFATSFAAGAAIVTAGVAATLLWRRLFSVPLIVAEFASASATRDDEENNETEGGAALRRALGKLRNTPPASSLQLSTEMTNERLVHRLWMDRSFQLSEKNKDPLQAHVRSVMLRAFWDSCKASAAAHNYSKVEVLLAEVVSRVNGLTPNRVDLKAELSAAVDPDHIVTMIENGALNAAEFFRVVQAVTSRIMQLEAPAHVEATRSWAAAFWDNHIKGMESGEGDVWDALRAFVDFVHAKVDEIALGAANYRLRMLVPFVEQHGLDYLRRWIDARVSRGELSFAAAETWISEEIALAHDASLAKKLRSGNASSIAHIYFKAVLRITWFGCKEESAAWSGIPETLMEDGEMIMQLRRDTGILLRAAYIVMRLVQIKPTDSLSACYQEVVRQISSQRRHLHIAHDEDGKRTRVAMPDTAAYDEGAHFDPEAGTSELLKIAFPDNDIRSEDETAIRALVSKGFGKDISGDPVFALVSKRLMTAALNIVDPQRRAGEGELNEQLSKLGLGSIKELDTDLMVYCKRIASLGRTNLLLFAKHYNNIVMSCAAKY